MRRLSCILMALSMVSMASALSITNGDFENQYDIPYNVDIAYWWDYGGPDLDFDQGPFFLGQTAASFSGTKCVYMGKEANTEEHGGNHTYVYQSIGTYDGTPAVVEIALDWGLAPSRTPGQMGVGVQILESDGTFEPNEWDGAAHDIYGFIKTDEDPDNPIILIGQHSVLRWAPENTVFHERFQFDLTGATVGRELFLRFNNIHGGGAALPWVQVDNITLSPAYVVNQLPEDGAIYVATELTSPENDLVFNVVDDSIVAVDVLFGTDPNFPADHKIVEAMPVTAGLNTVTLENELTKNLKWNTKYYWKVLAYESDGAGGLSLKYTGLMTSFTTIQEGPLLFGVTPEVQGIWPGDDAVFSVPFSVKSDTFQWYKEGNPDTPLYDSDPKYTIVSDPGNPNSVSTLTIHDVQLEDEGTYYCVGTETATGLQAATLTPGELFIKELKAYYPFETTYEDGGATYTPDIKGGKDMQLIGGTSVVTGENDPNSLFGGYLSLNNPRGVTHTQYAQIVDSSVAHYPEITISFWARPTILDLDFERHARVFSFGQDADNYFYLTLLHNTNEAFCEMLLDGKGRDTSAVGDIGYGTKWLYVVLTIGEELDEEGDTTTVGKIYINGQYGIIDGDGEIVTGGEGLYHPSEIPKPLNYIGKAINTTDSPPNFNGLIDEFKIYNYVKTAEEIAREYMEVRTDVEFICNMDAYDLADWDYNGNCRVDLPDLVEIAEKWLQNYLIYFD